MSVDNEPVAFPQDLSALSLEALNTLETQATQEFDTLAADDNIDDAGVERLTTLANGIETVRTERTGRNAALQTRRGQRDALTARMQAARSAPAATEPEDDESSDSDETEPLVEATPEPVVAGGVTTRPRTSLATAQSLAPGLPNRPSASDLLSITAASPTSGVQIGSRFETLDSLVTAVQSHSRALAPTHGTPSFLTVASVAKDYEYVIDDRSNLRDFDAMAKAIRSPDNIESIVAGGGWCAPSEIRYDFFNITCEDGMVDLPEFGVTRGGIRFPVSPSLADVFTGSFTNATNPWVWTEGDDILTVTGSPNKPCVRVICPSFSEVRLECYGICLTAGNLTDNAYPESTRNHLKLLMSAHYHAMNQRYLSQMQTLSTFSGTVTGGATATGDTIWSDAPTAVAIAAQDIRTRFGLCDDDVLEVIFPRWVKDAMRSDFSRRSGVEPVDIPDSLVNAQFSRYRVRVQWVTDWQIRAAGQFGGSTALLAWPSTVDFMIYPAGTVMRGNGMTLDLGVVRDSVLNAENDFTASWTEECHLIALIGHQIRRYTVPVCAGGKVGGVYTNCHTA